MYKQQIFFPITTKQFLLFTIVSFTILVWIFKIFASEELTKKEICERDYANQVADIEETNRNITQMCITDFEEWTELRECLNKLLLPPINSCNDGDSWSWADWNWNAETLRDKFWLGNCRFINEKHKLPRYNLEWKAYDIACDKGKSFEVKSPWYYEVEDRGYWTNLGNYLVLVRINVAEDIKTNERIVLWHIASDWKVGDLIPQYAIIWTTNVSWASTWMHVHIELWDGYYYADRNMLLTWSYDKWDWTRLLNHRGWDFGQPPENPPVYYFTAYNLWDPTQNDASPCIWASGKDLCYLERTGVRTMALTSDIRNTLGISFGQKIRLTWDKGCEGVYQVEDEMNKRFRQTPWIKRPWTNYYIKGDLPSKEGGACSIKKL